jgi:hypothetical protein
VASRRSKAVDDMKGKISSQLGKISSSIGHPPWRPSVLEGQGSG